MQSMKVPLSVNYQDQGNFSWRDRADKAVDLIAELASLLPSPFNLSDVGCGDMKLKESLVRREINATYTAFDLHPQTDSVTELDINRSSLPKRCDVVILLGVAEYLDDLQGVFSRLAKQTTYLVVSHVVRERSNYSSTQLVSLGWKNHLSSSDFGVAITQGGFLIERELFTSNKRTMLWRCRAVVS